MNVFWAFAFPAIIATAAVVFVQWARSLHFFNHSARHLDQIDIPNEVKEIRITEVEMLAGPEADFFFRHGYFEKETNDLELTGRELRMAIKRRLREARKWMHLIISNAALFQEVARFHLQWASSEEAEQWEKEDQLPFKVMDRALGVQLIAVTCLVRLTVIEARHMVWPFYAPQLAGQFHFRECDLVSWYRHLAKEILDLTQKYYDDITYTRFLFQLTGFLNLEEARGSGRL
jgi:hypothetical protein